MGDIWIFYDGHTYMLELKAGTKLSDAQKAMHPLLRAAGVHVAVIESIDELRAMLIGPWYPIPIRETKESTRLIKAGISCFAPLKSTLD